VAPALAGVLITVVGQGRTGEGVCFLLNGVSYLAVLASLLAIHPPAADRPALSGQLLAPLKEGFAYVLGFAPLRDLLLLAAVVGLVGMPGTLLPVFARKLGAGDASTFGFLTGATGLGALAATAYVASRPGLRGAGPRIAAAAALLGASLIGFAGSPALGPALAFRFLGGLALMVQMTSVTALVQAVADADKRGRALSLFGMAFLGMGALGNLAAGALAEVIGAEWTFVADGACCLAAALWFTLRLPHLRRVLRSALAERGHGPAAWSAPPGQ
jgi:MFS family permease